MPPAHVENIRIRLSALHQQVGELSALVDAEAEHIDLSPELARRVGADLAMVAGDVDAVGEALSRACDPQRHAFPEATLPQDERGGFEVAEPPCPGAPTRLRPAGKMNPSRRHPHRRGTCP
jgi:hypothetical protein